MSIQHATYPRPRPGRLAAGLAAGLLLGAPAWAEPASSEPPVPGGLLIADGGFGGVLEIRQHDVRVVINNGIAVTEIDQVFFNTESRQLEALYTFPVPKNASVANFSMWIGGKEMVGEVVEKERARQIYESYKRRNIDPGLLEQVDYKTFEMRVFPIPAGAEQRVRVTYYQELDVDADWATYVYPLATTTRQDMDSQVHGRFSLSLEAKSEVPIVGITSPSHADDFLVVDHGGFYKQASMEVTGGDLSRDVVIAFQTERASTGFDLLTFNDGEEDGFLQLTITAGPELEELNEGMDFVFVSDVSGSMGNGGKLGLSQRAVEAFMRALGDEDRFEQMTFNVSANVLFGELRTPNEGSLERAVEFLGDQRARGGTQLRPAVEAAYRYDDPDRTLNVVILSDGMTEQGEQQRLIQLIRQRPAGSRVFCIGVGNDVNRPLLQQLAEDAGGLASFISQGDDFERQAKAFRRKLMRPAATDVQVEIDGVKVYGVEPAKLPNLYHGSPVRMYARYTKGGKAQVKLHANVMGRKLEQSFAVELPARDTANPELERMWAWHRVQSLLDQDRAEGAGDRYRNEIIQLCEGHSIVSEYASFIVLENDAEYRRWKIERRNASRIQRDRRAQVALRERLDGMRDETARRIGPAVADDALASSRTPAATPAARNAPAPTRTATQKPRRFTGPRGGGAIDPLSGLAGLGVCALAFAARRRRSRDDA